MTPCAVPGCTRSTKLTVGWHFCRQHWQAIPADLRLLRRRLRKRYRERGELQQRRGFNLCTTDRCWRAFCGLNRRIRRAAIEQSAGIG